MAVLDTVADRQAAWSRAANQLKSRIDKARWVVLLLSVLGAILAATASQMQGAEPNVATLVAPRTWVAITGAVSLAFATFFTQRLLGADHVAVWVRARAISERLKREAFKFAAATSPYDDPDRAKAEAVLDVERGKIEDDGSDLLQHLTLSQGQGSSPRTALSEADYIAKRITGQIGWYQKKAIHYRKITTALRLTELVLAALATLVTAVASVGKTVLGAPFDFAAATAVLTTVAGAVLAHIEASRFDFLVVTYLATARRLEDRINRPHQPWSDFVNDCENVLSAENTSWIAKWTK